MALQASSRSCSHLTRQPRIVAVTLAAHLDARSVHSCRHSSSIAASRTRSIHYDVFQAQRQRRTYSTSPIDSASGGGAVRGASGRVYAGWWVAFVRAFAGWMGYSNRTSAAIRAGSAAYDACAKKADEEVLFLQNECRLPKSYQTWFTVTSLHLWLLSTRLRALPAPLGRLHLQELTTQAFLDFEIRLRAPPYNVTKSGLVKRYMDDLLAQHGGFGAALDAGIAEAETGDAVIAAAVWRNLWGAQWGGGVGGVDGVFASPIPGPENSKEVIEGSDEATVVELSSEAEGDDPDAKFAECLERWVVYIRQEVERLGKLSDEDVISGDGLYSFGRISASEQLP